MSIVRDHFREVGSENRVGIPGVVSLPDCAGPSSRVATYWKAPFRRGLLLQRSSQLNCRSSSAGTPFRSAHLALCVSRRRCPLEV